MEMEDELDKVEELIDEPNAEEEEREVRGMEPLMYGEMLEAFFIP